MTEMLKDKIMTPKEFLLWLSADGPWVLTAIIPDGAVTTKRFTDVDAAVKWATARNKKAGIYYALNPLRPGYKANKKASKSDVAAMAFLHVDVDPAPGKPIEAERARALKSLEDFTPAPTMIIDSGGGFQGLWCLDKPEPVSEDWPVDRLESYNVQLENLLSADRCHNLDRIMRLPGFINHPNAKKRAAGRLARQSSIVALNDHSYPLDAFSPAVEAPTAPSDPGPGAEDPDFDLSTLDDGLLDLINDTGEPDKSAHIVGVAAALLRAGASRISIEEILLNPAHGCSAHCRDQDNSARAAGRAVDAATKIIGAEKAKNAAIFRKAREAAVDEHYSSTVAIMLPGSHFTAQKKEALVELVRKRSGEPKSTIKKLFNSKMPPPRKPTVFLEAYVYVTRPKVFIHRSDLREYDREQFDNHHATRWPVRSKNHTASSVFLNEGGLQLYEPTYAPGGKEIIGDKFNLWQDTGIKPTEGDVSLWLEHGRWLVPDDVARNIILDRMAFDVQHPDLKPNWHVFLGGLQGIGKNWWTYPLVAAIGIDNHSTVDPTMLESGYGDWMQGKKQIFVDEMMNFKKTDFNNKLKPLLAKPPLILLCNKKYGGVFRLPNLLSFWMGSNLKDALKLENSDRRLMMNWTDVEPKDAAYYDKLWAFYGTEASNWTDNRISDVVGWLGRRDLSRFSASGRAPMTEYKAAVILASRDPLEAFLQDAKDAGAWPLHTDLVSISKLQHVRYPHGVGKVTLNRLAKALEDIGAEDLGRVVVSEAGAKPEQKPTIWAVRPRTADDGFGWKALSAEALKDAVKDDLRRWGDNDPGPQPPF